jgi:Na+/proline symporter
MQKPDRSRVFDFSFALDNEYTFWAGLLGGAVLSFGSHGVDQLIVQRYLAAKTQSEAALALSTSGIVVLLQFAFFLVLGMGLAAFYAQHPPAEPFTKSDEVFLDFIVKHTPVGVLGIVLGAVFSAAMSTLSSSLNSSASALVNDIVLPMQGRSSDHPSGLGYAKGATLLFGALQVAVGCSGLGGGAIVGQVLGIASFTTGILLGVYALGIATVRAGQSHALFGLACGLALLVDVRAVFWVLAALGVAALGLLRAGQRVRVFEQVAELGEVGAGLSITPNAGKALVALGLGETLQRIGSRPPDGVTSIDTLAPSARRARLTRARYGSLGGIGRA